MSNCQRCEATNVSVSYLTLTSAEKDTKLWLCNICFEQARRLWYNFMKEDKDEGELTDDSIMYFGKYKDRRMKNVPAQYLIWIGDQTWINAHPRLQRYIEKNRVALEEEIAEKE